MKFYLFKDQCVRGALELRPLSLRPNYTYSLPQTRLRPLQEDGKFIPILNVLGMTLKAKIKKNCDMKTTAPSKRDAEGNPKENFVVYRNFKISFFNTANEKIMMEFSSQKLKTFVNSHGKLDKIQLKIKFDSIEQEIITDMLLVSDSGSGAYFCAESDDAKMPAGFWKALHLAQSHFFDVFATLTIAITLSVGDGYNKISKIPVIINNR